MLKKITSILAVATVAATMSASAAINVIWQGFDGFLRSDDITGLTEPANGSQHALAQLIYTPVNAYGQAQLGGGVAAGEQVLDTFIITDSGGADPYGGLAPQSYTGAFMAGFIYARIFDQGTGNDPANQIVNGTWYYNGPRVATIDNLTPDSPDTYNANGANTSVNYGVGDTLNLQVPEPSVLAFFGIGGLALAIRRRIKA